MSIGDGVFNCRHCYDPDDFPNQLSGCTPGCNNTLQYYQQAKQDLYTFVNEALSERNVPIHWILVGGAVAPHTVERTLDESGVGDCLSDFDARKENVPYVKGGYNEDKFNSLGEAYNRMSTVDPWYEANTAVYEVAAATQGLFGPIRPPSDECTPKVQCDNSEERITEDPLCRTMVEQIDEYMNVVLGENPFILVQVSEG